MLVLEKVEWMNPHDSSPVTLPGIGVGLNWSKNTAYNVQHVSIETPHLQ